MCHGFDTELLTIETSVPEFEFRFHFTRWSVKQSWLLMCTIPTWHWWLGDSLEGFHLRQQYRFHDNFFLKRQNSTKGPPTHLQHTYTLLGWKLPQTWTNNFISKLLTDSWRVHAELRMKLMLPPSLWSVVSGCVNVVSVQTWCSLICCVVLVCSN